MVRIISSRALLTSAFSILLLLNINAQDFEVAPVRLEFDSEPGDNQTKVVTVKNHSNKKTSFIVVLADFLPSNVGDKKVMAPNSTKRSCANWLNINPSFFELNPSDEIQIQVGMMVPNDEYSAAWCMMYIQPTREQTVWSSDKQLGAGVMVSGRIGVQIQQSPKSNANHSLKISNLNEISSPSDSVRKFSATIENLGEKITSCKVFLVASNIQTAEEYKFNPSEYEIFPKMTRVVELFIPNKLNSGSYALAAIVDYGSKYSLEGTQIIIDVKEEAQIPVQDSAILK